MADVVDVTPAKKAKATAKAKKPKTAPSHPKISEMVTTAISTLKERGGSSLAAIKKYIGANYKVDVEKLSPFIRKYLRSAVATGGLVQTKGKGANGSFRIGGASAGVKKTKTAAASKPKKAAVKAAKPKKPKAATPKKKVAKPKKVTPKKPKSSPAKKAKPAAAKKKPAVKKPKVVKLAATKAKKPKASPKKKAAAKKGKK